MGHTIDRGVLCVPSYKTIPHEVCFDGFNGPDYARIVRGKKADQRHHQDAGVEVFGSVILHKRVHIRVKTLPANLFMDGPSELLPSSDIYCEATQFCRPWQAIDGDPRHHLGVDEMSARAAHLP